MIVVELGRIAASSCSSRHRVDEVEFGFLACVVAALVDGETKQVTVGRRRRCRIAGACASGG